AKRRVAAHDSKKQLGGTASRQIGRTSVTFVDKLNCANPILLFRDVVARIPGDFSRGSIQTGSRAFSIYFSGVICAGAGVELICAGRAAPRPPPPVPGSRRTGN
ncbi:hypothetical protein EVAR_70245_1, partial [Eumeta japonica]